jgi:hypothetical protein
MKWKDLFYQKYAENGFDEIAIKMSYNLEMEMRAFFEFNGIVPTNLKLQNIERSGNEIHYFWESASEEAMCPYCKASSRTFSNEYYMKKLQDNPKDGLAVYHDVLFRKFNCENDDCSVGRFEEQSPEFAEACARKTVRFKHQCVTRALGCGCHRAEMELKAEGASVSNDSIASYVIAEGEKKVAENLTADAVRVLAVDDINLRKGDKSSGCTVFVDGDTHKVLVIVRGTTKEETKKIAEKFQSAKFFSRDRASSYSSAGDELGKTQIADRFHLIENAHKAVKETLMTELPVNIFIRQGDGWVSPDGIISRESVAADPQEVEIRIKLAGLSLAKAEKYRRTIKMLGLSEKGLRSAEIAHEMGISQDDVRVLRRTAASTITNVNERIATRLEQVNASKNATTEVPGRKVFKTVAGPRVEPAITSIVEPYRQTVIELWKAGGNKKTIHPVLTEMGFKGSENAIYQYILKLGKENPELMQREKTTKMPKKVREMDFDATVAEALPELSLDKITRDTVYKEILKEASETRSKEDAVTEESAHEASEAQQGVPQVAPALKARSKKLTYENSRSPVRKEIWELIHWAEINQTEENKEQAAKDRALTQKKKPT